tara:strand:+ start:147 stop:719 length:573 start_codon:yes stop_codon:yes gene_type:complete
MIVKDIKELNQPCEPCSSVEEGEEIAAKLLNYLNNSDNGIGLAANQIGINKRVCVINVKDPLILINPLITYRSDETTVFPEGCLSFPNKHIRTIRNVDITVEADNYESALSFSMDGKDIKDALECACVQHEIDHLDGFTMFDREFKQNPISVKKSFGRNEKVKITNGKETKTLKWKKAERLVDEGNWQLT